MDTSVTYLIFYTRLNGTPVNVLTFKKKSNSLTQDFSVVLFLSSQWLSYTCTTQNWGLKPNPVLIMSFNEENGFTWVIPYISGRLHVNLP